MAKPDAWRIISIHVRHSLFGIAILAAFLISTGVFAQSSNSFATGPAPSWVDNVPAAEPTVLSEKEAPKLPQTLRLFDDQVNATENAHYFRGIREINNDSGVQDGSRIRIFFDPVFQKLTIHDIAIRRAGKLLGRLQPEKIKVIQQESDLERHIYDGTLSALIFLDDVRAGDQIEYSYTIHGFNPILTGRYAGSFSTQWGTAVQQQRFRLLWPKERPLAYASHGNTPQPRIKELAHFKEYVWEARNLPPILEEDQTPGWYDAYPWVQFSEFAGWADVARWAAALYPPTSELSSELRQKLAEWSEHKDPVARATAALQFVQQEVRYLGFEFGPNSHRPSDPSTVFSRRFGDCKDKSYLLCTILRKLGIEAVPALVNTSYRGTIADWLPSPFAFNHVVAQVTIGETTFYVDPTRGYQCGPATKRYIPDYKLCLLLRDGVTALTSMPKPKHALPLTTITEDFKVRGHDEATEFNVTTLFQGAAAERARGQFASASKQEVEKDYLNYYARRYPRISMKRPVQTRDDTNENSFTTIESYEIKGFWTLSADKRNYEAEFHASSIDDLIRKPETTLRTMPLAVKHPEHFIQRTRVMLPDKWPADHGEETVLSTASVLKVKRSCIETSLSMEYEYQSVTNCVTVRDCPKYIEDLDKMQNALGYYLTWPSDNPPPGQFNWSIFAAGTLLSLFLVAGAILVYRFKPATPPVLPDPATLSEKTLVGLGGWLILVGIGLAVSLFRIAWGTWTTFPSYSVESWNALTIPGSATYHQFWAPYLILALFANLTMIVSAILLLVLFFQRRRTFPRLYILYLIFITLVSAFDFVACQAIPTVATASNQSSTRDLTRMIVACAIWIPYMLVSRRVKLTFVR